MFSLLVFRNVSSRILVIKNYSKKDWTLSNYEFPNCHCKQVMNNTTYVIGPKSIVGALQVKLMFPRRTGRPLSVTLWETKHMYIRHHRIDQFSLSLVLKSWSWRKTHVERIVPIHLRCFVIPGILTHSPTRVAFPSGLSCPRACGWDMPNVKREHVLDLVVTTPSWLQICVWQRSLTCMMKASK